MKRTTNQAKAPNKLKPRKSLRSAKALKAVKAPKRGRGPFQVLDLNTKILIGIRNELERHTSILDKNTLILDKHTSIFEEHSKRLTAVEGAVKELARETRRWVAHFDRDYLRLATDFDLIRSRVEICEKKLSTRP